MDLNYKKLKLKSGLEIHFQLDLGKLFCRCPSILKESKPNFKIKRRLNSVTSETGEKDLVANYEISKNKYAIYEVYEDTNCLVELDESPAEKVNQEALKTTLQIAKLLNCEIVDEILVMRKQVINYSNPSGFQRTALIARNGFITTSKGKVNIENIYLEEDAARKISENKDYVTYRLDRLGIPLIEIVTAPDIKTPEQAKEVAEYLGMIVKSTGKKRIGIGTIRQDVNLSIKGLNRIELKGFQDLKSMPKVINIEIKRQLDLLKKGKKINSEVRNVLKDNTSTYLRPMPSSSRLYPETDVKTIEINKKLLKSIKIPELILEKTQKLKKLGIQESIAKELIKQNINLKDYNYKLDKREIATILIEIPKDIKKKEKLNYSFKKEDFDLVLGLLDKKQISKSAIKEILIEIAKGKKVDISKYELIDEKLIDKEIKRLVKVNENLIKEKKERSIKILMGELMKKFKGKTDNSLLFKKLKKEIDLF
jgi:Glu-tRNA(Gln) amidotransferase subunit E-like FAD-binding protein